MLLRQPAHVSGALGMMANWRLEPMLARLGELKSPVTLIAAADDPMVPSRVAVSAARGCPDGSKFPRGGHLLHEVIRRSLPSTLIRKPRAGNPPGRWPRDDGSLARSAHNQIRRSDGHDDRP
jgi:magnesium chelatase accessory protein